MKITKRQMDLLQCLYKYPNTSLKELGGILRVSVQTLKTDLGLMRDILSAYNISITVSNGNELKAQGRENLPRMRRDAKEMLEFTLQRQVLLVLLLTDDFVVLQEIADVLFVSKSSVEKLMACLLKKYPDELQSLRHYGIRCILPQLEKRSMFARLLEPYVKGIDFEAEINRFDTIHFPLLQYFSYADLRRGVAAVQALQDVKTFTLADKSICHLFLCLLFTARHHREKHSGRLGEMFARMAGSMPGADLYTQAANYVAAPLELRRDPREISYICYLMMTLRKQEFSDSGAIAASARELVQKIFQAIQNKLSVDLHREETLRNGLALHIQATVLRRNLLEPLTADYNWNDIRHQYPLSFEMAVIAAELVDKEHAHSLSSDELIYLTLHFQAAIERMKQSAPKIGTVIVCHYGMAAASLIETRIHGLFNAIEVVGSYSMRKFLELKDLRCDLILTTETIPDCGIPVIYVTPVLRGHEMKAITAFIETKGINEMLEMIVMEAEVFHFRTMETARDILAEVVDSLQARGYVTAGYLDSVMERERISSTDVGCLAIPHGDPLLVARTKLAVVRLEEPALWKVSTVKYVFLLAISHAQFTRNFSLFSTFYKRLAKSNLKDDSKRFDGLDDASFKIRLARMLDA